MLDHELACAQRCNDPLTASPHKSARTSEPASLSPRVEALGLTAVFTLALLLRAANFAKVFHDGHVVFAVGDGLYRVRRALYTFFEFPKVLFFDPYVNYPDGATINLSPMLDILIGSVAHTLASDERGFEIVAAWTNPLLGALTVLPLYYAARRLTTPFTALGAAALFGVLPVAVLYARIGNVDHHAAVGLLSTCGLLVCMHLLDPRTPEKRAFPLAIALGFVRAGLLWTYHGSLLHIALLDGVVLLGATLLGKRRLFAAEAGSLLLTLALVAPGILFLLPPPLGGPYSAISLSNLHLLILSGIGLTSALAWWLPWNRAGSGRAAAGRLVRIGGLGIAVSGGIALWPGVRDGLLPAFQFLTKTDAVGAMVVEQLPLFHSMGSSGWGHLALAIPVLPLVALALARNPVRRSPALVLAIWTAFFGILTLTQRRYGNDLAASGCIAIALAGAAIVHAAAPRRGVWRRSLSATIVLIGVLLLWEPFRNLYRPWAEAAAPKLFGITQAPPLDPFQSLYQFARQVRRATPETSGFLDSNAAAPEYGIAGPANLGHALHYVARRATPADPFWSFIGPQNWQLNQNLLSTTREDEALEMTRALRARYLVVAPGLAQTSVAGRLFHQDGRGVQTLPPLSHFRLVTEGPPNGAGILGGRFARGAPPYKLFEVVEGAMLEIQIAAEKRVRASLTIHTETDRRFQYAMSAVANSDGIARMRVPYANDANGPTRTAGLWILKTAAAGEPCVVKVSEQDVLEGRTVRVDCNSYSPSQGMKKTGADPFRVFAGRLGLL